MSLYLLQPIKGALVGLQWALRMHGFNPAEPDHDELAPAPYHRTAPMTDIDSDRIARLNDFVRRMNAVDRDLSHKVIRPKDAATLILVDRSGRVPKVLLGKRHARHKFMPGKFVFPGGGVDPTDKAMPVATSLDPQAEMRLMQRFQQGQAPVRPARSRWRRSARPSRKPGCCSAGAATPPKVPAGAWARIRTPQGPARPRATPLHRPRDHAAAAGRGASMRGSSPWMRARSRIGSRA